MFIEYDVIVVGAGHAGSEAAAAAARLGSKTLLITMNMNAIAAMSCNPAMGGIAKGQIVREIDALGGMSGIITDKSMIQFRMLNKSKGPAMWSPRAQSDRMRFSEEWRLALENTPNLDFWQDTVTELIFKGEKLSGVKTALGIEIAAKSVILTNGTFLNGTIHIGMKQYGGGRMGDPASKRLTEALNEIGFESDRMKTGTPVRVDGRSLDFSKMTEQPGDEEPAKFSFTETPKLTKQRSCFLVHTNEAVHDVLRTGFEFSPMFNGRIQGIGPRYCPSIEDKIERFSDKNRHQLFIEPEGWNTIEYYINGFSSSLPEEIQFKALRLIPGFENAKIFRPGYAIEYDFFPPVQLKASLETKLVENLYFAGQINGTTGYEEAGAQGLMAGINAHRKVHGEEEIVLKRSEAYIGVLIDDLITKGVDEPYRMFTSRAEYRLMLRQDNADLRLTPLAFELGMVSEDRMEQCQKKEGALMDIEKYTQNNSAEPDDVNPYLKEAGTPEINQKTRISQIILRPQVHLEALIENLPNFKEFIQSENLDSKDILESAEILLKYSSYIRKEEEIADRLNRMENLKLSPDFDYHGLQSISYEAREKLSKIKPATLGQASRISGVSPSDINVLAIYLSK